MSMSIAQFWLVIFWLVDCLPFLMTIFRTCAAQTIILFIHSFIGLRWNVRFELLIWSNIHTVNSNFNYFQLMQFNIVNYKYKRIPCVSIFVNVYVWVLLSNYTTVHVVEPPTVGLCQPLCVCIYINIILA